MICFLNYSISPYHQARFIQLRHQIKEEVIFVELASKDNIYPWHSQAKSVDAVTLFPDREFTSVPSSMMVKTLEEFLDKRKPNVVLSASYASSAMRFGPIWARRNGAVSICVNNSWRGNKPRFLPWEWVKGLWCRYAYDGMFLSGERCKAYYMSLGFPERRIWLGQNSVDNDFFTRQSQIIRAKAEYYRALYGLPNSFFLCVARLSPEKNLPRLLKAFSIYKNYGDGWDLVLTGSGPMEEELKVLSSQLGISQNVQFKGWKQVEEMPVFYALASSLILPSLSETWGNVVNEAMASSLPVLVSDRCGCQPELCFHGVNGFGFNPYHVEEIANAMINISSRANELSQMGSVSLDLVRRYSTANYATSLTDCIQTLRASK